MTACVAALLIALALPPSRVEMNGVRVDVEITSQQYRWTVTNLGAPPIARFEAKLSNCYAEIAPEGWDVELKDGRLRAWTDTPSNTIRRGQSRTFQAQYSSDGAVLGIVPAIVGFADGAGAAELHVWGPVDTPPSAIAAVAATLTACAGLHAAIIYVRRRRSASRGG